MRLLKKAMVILLAAVTAIPFTFAGCGVQEDDGNYVGTLKIGYTRAGYGIEFAEAWTEGYNAAHPDEKIKFVIDDGVEGSYIGTRLQTNSELCDIFMVMETGWHNWAKSGYMEPLDDLMTMKNDDGNAFGDVLRDEYNNYGKMNGVRYVLPQTGPSAPGFAYDETLFKKHGLEVPKTVTELKALVDQINALPCNNDGNSDNDIAPFAWGGMVAGYWNSPVMAWWAQYDGEEKVKEFFDMETVEVYNQRKGLEEGLKLFRELVCTGEGVPKNSLPKAMSKNQILAQNDFVLGRAAMLVGVYGLENETKNSVGEDSVLKMFYAPYIDGAKTDENGDPIKIMISEGQDFMFIPSASPNKELAKKFLLWISTENMCRSYTRYTAFAAPYKYNTDNIEGISPLAQSMIDETKGIVMVGHIFSTNPIVNQLRLLVWGSNTSPYDKMVINNVTPTEALNGAYNFAKGQWDALQREYFGK